MRDRYEGERVYLRRMMPEDTELAVKWRNADCVRRQFIFKDTVTPEMHRKWYETRVLTGQVVQYVIGIKESGEEIGSQYYKDIDNEGHTAEYGIYIGEEAALGKGYGSEVMQLALDYARSDMGMKEIYLRFVESNERAKRLYRKMGFEEYKREDGDISVIFMKRTL